MLLFIDYKPATTAPAISTLVVGTPLSEDSEKMLKVNSFTGKEADKVYSVLVGSDKADEIMKIRKEDNE